MFGLSPKNTKIDLANLVEADLEYYCTTQHIDKQVMKGRGLAWDQSVADNMEKEVRYYFVVKTNREYDVIAGPAFEEWLFKKYPPTVIVTGDIKDFDFKSEPGKIVSVTHDAEISYISPVEMKLTAKASACKDHYVDLLLKQYPDRVQKKKQSFTKKKRK